ncbi:MAG: TIGR02206 family membrane protein [Brachybacterium sp.]|nr:TIGR02206 family membrane protein [Brachybacterium sp.]
MDPAPRATGVLHDVLTDGSATGMMPSYGPAHVAALIVIAVGGVCAVVLGRRMRGSEREPAVRAAAGWTLLVITLAWLGWGLVPQNFDLDESLPLHFSDALRVITALALIRRAPWAIVISCFWGLTLNLQSIITPQLVYQGYPLLEYLMYWGLHGIVLLAPLYLVVGLGDRPTWYGYAVALAATFGWAAIAMTGNALTGANYGYLNREPAGTSILDLLGGWPWYLLWEAVLVTTVWAGMTRVLRRPASGPSRRPLIRGFREDPGARDPG